MICPHCQPKIPNPKELQQRLESYFGNGGLFNPEMMEHDKVRDLLSDLQDYLRHKETPCHHPPALVFADILEGELHNKTGYQNRQIQWCSLCGAYRFVWGDAMRNVDPLKYGEWTKPGNP